MTGALILLWLSYVIGALLWAGGAMCLIGAVVLALGLCRAARDGDGSVATDREIDR